MEDTFRQRRPQKSHNTVPRHAPIKGARPIQNPKSKNLSAVSNLGYGEGEQDTGMELGLVNLDDGTALCLKCNRSFTSAAQAKIHFKEIHCTDRNDKKFACAICHKSFAVKRYLNNHMRAQHGLTQSLMKRNYVPNS